MAFSVDDPQTKTVALTCPKHGDFEASSTSVTAVADLHPVEHKFKYFVLFHCLRKGCHLSKEITRDQYIELAKYGAAPITAEVALFLLQWSYKKNPPAPPWWRRAIANVCQFFRENW